MSVELVREVRDFVECTTRWAFELRVDAREAKQAGELELAAKLAEQSDRVHLSPAECLVLYELADMAQEKDRKGFPARMALPEREVFAARCGLSVDGLRKVLGRLAARGLEVRMPIGTDTRGEPLYALPGRRSWFLLPDLSVDALHGRNGRWDERATYVGREGHLGGTDGPPMWDERADGAGREGYLNRNEPEGEPEWEPEGEPSDPCRDRGHPAGDEFHAAFELEPDAVVDDLVARSKTGQWRNLPVPEWVVDEDTAMEFLRDRYGDPDETTARNVLAAYTRNVHFGVRMAVCKLEEMGYAA